MTITIHKNLYAFDSQYFEAQGVQFMLTGVETDKHGQTIDHIKNLENGKHSTMSRDRLVGILKQEGYEIQSA